MRPVKPSVRLVASPKVDFGAMRKYLEEVGGESWLERVDPIYWPETTHWDIEGEALPEFAGRLCYRSWEPGLNPNVTKVREDVQGYFDNILDSGHGSVFEHAYYVFVFHNVSRVFTHELVRHRVGVSISQESMRYVRLTDIPFWWPDWAEEDEELMARGNELLGRMEEFQLWMAEHFGLDEEGADFALKKAKTSFMRRFAPDGVATSIVWGANVRTLRHVLEMRTSPAAEEEIRLVFNEVGLLMRDAAPHLFADYEVVDGAWIPGRGRKV